MIVTQVTQALHSGQHECVFMAYGQTSAGKTYTIEVRGYYSVQG